MFVLRNIDKIVVRCYHLMCFDNLLQINSWIGIINIRLFSVINLNCCSQVYLLNVEIDARLMLIITESSKIASETYQSWNNNVSAKLYIQQNDEWRWNLCNNIESWVEDEADECSNATWMRRKCGWRKYRPFLEELLHLARSRNVRWGRMAWGVCCDDARTRWCELNF